MSTSTTETTVAWVAHHGMTSAGYQEKFDQYVREGFRLIWVDGYAQAGQARYAAIWDKSPGAAWVARHGMTSAAYQSEFDKYVGQGFRLVLVSGYGVGGTDYYAAIWDKSPGAAWVARHGMTSPTYQSEFDKYVGQGYRLRHVSGYEAGGQDRYAAIWDKSAGPAWVARHGMSSGTYQSEFDKYVGQGYRLELVDGYPGGGADRYAAIWTKSPSGAWVARHGMTSGVYQSEFDKYVGQGYRLVLVSGYEARGQDLYAAIWRK